MHVHVIRQPTGNGQARWGPFLACYAIDVLIELDVLHDVGGERAHPCTLNIV